jgi:hypothetical protein
MASCSVHTGGSFRGVKCQGCDAVSLCLCHAKVKSDWSYTSAPLACLCGMYRDNFTFSMSVIHLLFQGTEITYTVKCFFFLCLKRTIICSAFPFWILLSRSSSVSVYFYFFSGVFFPLLKKVQLTILNIITGISYYSKVLRFQCSIPPLELL